MSSSIVSPAFNQYYLTSVYPTTATTTTKVVLRYLGTYDYFARVTTLLFFHNYYSSFFSLSTLYFTLPYLYYLLHHRPDGINSYSTSSQYHDFISFFPFTFSLSFLLDSCNILLSCTTYILFVAQLLLPSLRALERGYRVSKTSAPGFCDIACNIAID